MFPKQLDIDVALDGFRLAATVPLTPIEAWWNQLVERNALSRARDEDPSLRPAIRVRVACVECCAPIYFLTLVEQGGEMFRACRKCGAEFSLAV